LTNGINLKAGAAFIREFRFHLVNEAAEEMVPPFGEDGF